MVSLISRIDTGHEDIIHDAKMDHHGMQLATCSSDNLIKIFSVKNNVSVLSAELRGHYGPVWQVAWAHPHFGNILASCSYDRKVIIWKEMRPGEWVKIYEHSNHDASVNSIAFAPKEFGLILACASADGSISVLINKDGSWDTKKMVNAHAIGCNAVSWCPSGVVRSLRVFRNQQGQARSVKHLVSGGCDNSVKIWTENEAGKWVEVDTLEGHTDWVRDVDWAPCIGSPTTNIASCSQDRKVIIWSSEDLINWQPTIMNVFDDVVWNVSWSISGHNLAVSGADNKVSLWKESKDHEWVCITDNTNKACQKVN